MQNVVAVATAVNRPNSILIAVILIIHAPCVFWAIHCIVAWNCFWAEIRVFPIGKDFTDWPRTDTSGNLINIRVHGGGRSDDSSFDDVVLAGIRRGSPVLKDVSWAAGRHSEAVR